MPLSCHPPGWSCRWVWLCPGRPPVATASQPKSRTRPQARASFSWARGVNQPWDPREPRPREQSSGTQIEPVRRGFPWAERPGLLGCVGPGKRGDGLSAPQCPGPACCAGILARVVPTRCRSTPCPSPPCRPPAATPPGRGQSFLKGSGGHGKPGHGPETRPASVSVARPAGLFGGHTQVPSMSVPWRRPQASSRSGLFLYFPGPRPGLQQPFLPARPWVSPGSCQENSHFRGLGGAAKTVPLFCRVPWTRPREWGEAGRQGLAL